MGRVLGGLLIIVLLLVGGGAWLAFADIKPAPRTIEQPVPDSALPR